MAFSKSKIRIEGLKGILWTLDMKYSFRVDKDLVVWSHPKGSGKQLRILMDISDEWCPSGVVPGSVLLS